MKIFFFVAMVIISVLCILTAIETRNPVDITWAIGLIALIWVGFWSVGMFSKGARQVRKEVGEK